MPAMLNHWCLDEMLSHTTIKQYLSRLDEPDIESLLFSKIASHVRKDSHYHVSLGKLDEVSIGALDGKYEIETTSFFVFGEYMRNTTPEEIFKKDACLKKAIEKKENIFFYNPDLQLSMDVDMVVDWLLHLKTYNERIWLKVPKMTFIQMIAHSNKWHEGLERRANKRKKRTQFDDNCPIVLDHGEYAWVWLKTDRSRDDESLAMGNCVGQGGYDNLSSDSGVFSLRDKSGKSFVTLHMVETQIRQAKGFANREVPQSFLPLIDRAAHVIGIRLKLFSDPTKKISKGWMTQEDLTNSSMSRVWKKACFDNEVLGNHNGPSIEHFDGTKEWYLDGNLHREDGPAIEGTNGDEEWWINGKLHREIEPAVKKSNGDEEWWLDGHIKKRRLHIGDVEYYDRKTISVNGEDFPEAHLYLKSVLHRDDGPAVIKADGTKIWVNRGRLDRLDGPAIEGGTFKGTLSIPLDDHDDRSITICAGDLVWCDDGRISRPESEGPALICKSGEKRWYRNGVLHRTNGPAFIRKNGVQEWWMNGRRIIGGAEEALRRKNKLFIRGHTIKEYVAITRLSFWNKFKSFINPNSVRSYGD